MAPYTPLIISLILFNTALALMIVDMKYIKWDFVYSLTGKILMLIPPLTIILAFSVSFAFMFKKFANYFKP